MDCNKEEAIRARDIAEKKMESKDFTGARKFILRAQQLNPDAENISQMLMVCDVHCAAEKKLLGNEMDWYGILQIEQTANEATIRKQYRKYALLLHPDKNKFIGAEAAFKLVGEAQRVLLDQEKRRLHDMRCKPAVPYRPPQRAGSTFNVGVQANFRGNFTAFTPQHPQPQPQGHSGFGQNRATFWTVCPFCSVRYQYYKEVVNRSLCCQNCKKPFVAYDMELQGAHPQPMSNLHHTTFFQQQNSFNHRAEMGHPGNSQSEKRRMESLRRTHNTSGAASEKLYGKKRRKQTSESSESCDTGSSSDFEENVVTNEDSKKDVGRPGAHHPRRSSRQRHKISYNENLSDDDSVITPKKSKRSKSSDSSDEDSEEVYVDEASKINNQSGSADVDDDQRETNKLGHNCSEASLSRRSKGGKKVSHKETLDNDYSQRSMGSAGDPEVNLFSCSDPDFNDFDKLRNRECFKLGQIWAMYDNIDTMPRFYARVKKVFPSGFKVQITWLEPEANDECQSKCVDEKVPVSCGEFVSGATETMTDCGSMFSHAVSLVKGGRKDIFKIYPRKGQIWALFKNWDKNYNRDSNCQYEYEFAETLSEYSKESGIDVALLAKVKGFSCLFCRMVKEGENSFRVPAAELFRFSHQVPSFPLTGDERDDVPEGSFELDPAALPPNVPEIAIPQHLKKVAANAGLNTLKSTAGPNGDAGTHKADADTKSDDGDVAEAYEIPDPEFHNFDVDKTSEKFRVGQVWALYSDEDALPKYYAQIKKITHKPEFELRLLWLESSELPDDTIEWHDKSMPISCGRFRTQRTKMHSYYSTKSFSHLVRTIPVPKNGFYISPSLGEVWALYKNWTPEIRCSDMDKCEYVIVEVIEDDDLQKEVLVLDRVHGFNSVFKAKTKGDSSTVTMVITRVELLRFSHRIPAFRLTDERGGSLRGCLELDPAALPIYFFY
ncbi:uncharacterized protein LOC111009660 [Momordica charantia]|uniref:Uncharacterized protein LOC111009660 n=1 Tax=Momordica charantia TaxID=3673 RepID=A0A6J1C9X2_MOMCH|nr:uncharacterized protein LOC111009660 [Momordica charantia]XP_022138504.1 uncharacterized protein LOC111009660 [Momordica charantia]XP_022138506.1 uncharacterized protein LOC111009660 [Momordica charantia]XP_022138507.1 uncharacterized protein LOC111009660 [Momordica charantia]